jgi:MoaA/NifB/PqqE/SkfB family radical SAM enzyme
MSPSGSNITPEVIQKMKAAGVRMISLSLDGSHAAVHDGFRQVEGAFDLAKHNMALLGRIRCFSHKHTRYPA